LQRIYVHNSIFDIFIEQLVEKTKLLKAGNPTNESTDVSSLIDLENAIRVETWVFEAVSAGAKILCGGKRRIIFMNLQLLPTQKQV